MTEFIQITAIVVMLYQSAQMWKVVLLSNAFFPGKAPTFLNSMVFYYTAWQRESFSSENHDIDEVLRAYDPYGEDDAEGQLHILRLESKVKRLELENQHLNGMKTFLFAWLVW